jgi:hypothetical protein
MFKGCRCDHTKNPTEKLRTCNRTNNPVNGPSFCFVFFFLARYVVFKEKNRFNVSGTFLHEVASTVVSSAQLWTIINRCFNRCFPVRCCRCYHKHSSSTVTKGNIATVTRSFLFRQSNFFSSIIGHPSVLRRRFYLACHIRNEGGPVHITSCCSSPAATSSRTFGASYRALRQLLIVNYTYDHLSTSTIKPWFRTPLEVSLRVARDRSGTRLMKRTTLWV